MIGTGLLPSIDVHCHMKYPWHVTFVLSLVVAYFAGFGVIRAGCDKVSGPFAGGPGILVGPEWYGGTKAGGLLKDIYWPMFWLEEKITGEMMCFELTSRSAG